jgi:RNA polymerase sigma factor (sigma-70 family)
MEAEDILQDGFIKIYGKLHTFKFEGSFEGWCRRIMVNTAIKYFKKGSNKNEFSNLDEVKEERFESKAIGIISEKELLELINGLPHGYKTVFNLHAIEGYKHTEIAEMLGITESTSRTQFLKARKVLQSVLKRMQLMLI